MTLLAKKIADLTPEELEAVYRPLGTSALPYVDRISRLNKDGGVDRELGIIADDDDPLRIYSDMPHEHVFGTLMREMVMPSLIHVQNELIWRRRPEARNRLMAILGDPGSGKSHLAKMMANVCDARGPVVIDCGGRYMGDLLFEQVIDFGEDFKTALTDRIRNGGLSDRSIQVFDEEFPEALRRDNGQIVDIDWDKIGTPKNLGTDETPKWETTAEATSRAMELIQGTIATWESIPVQAVNSVGVRKQFGPLLRAYQEGRTLVLDEYTKSVEGSDDSLQTVLQFLTGEIDTVTIDNSMKINGKEETSSFTLDRKDMRLGFSVVMTGNKDTDGHSTHRLSTSANSRIDAFEILTPTPMDWKHRISQILTGLPLSTLYSVFSEMAQSDSQAFAETLMQIRFSGLSDEQKENVSLLQASTLNNWMDTNDAIEKFADYYMFWSRVIDPNSDLYNSNLPQNDVYIELLDEIDAKYCDDSALDLRKVIKDINDALDKKPEAKSVADVPKLKFNFNTLSAKHSIPMPPKPEVLAASFGDRLETVILGRIARMTEGRKNLEKVLVKEGMERGVLSIPNSDVPTLAKLLNQDIYATRGGIKSAEALRRILAGHVRADNFEQQDLSDEDILPLDKAAALCEEVARTSGSDNPSPYVGRVITVGGSLTEAFKHAASVDGMVAETYTPPESVKDSQLVRAADFLEALQVPVLEEINMRSLWRQTLSNDKIDIGRGNGFENLSKDTPFKPTIELAEGRYKDKTGITTTLMQGNSGEAVPVHVVADGENGKILIVTDQVDESVQKALAHRYKIVTYDQANAHQEIEGFLSNLFEHPSHAGGVAELEGSLFGAFLFRAGDTQGLKRLSAMMLDREVAPRAPVYMINELE